MSKHRAAAKIQSLFLFAVLLIAVFSCSGCGGGGGGTAQPGRLVSITVTPAAPNLAVGTTASLKALGTFSDNTSQDLTNTVTWSSSLPGVATVSSAGVVSANAPGTSTITATSGGVTGTAQVSVGTLQTISVSPTSNVTILGQTQPFTASGTILLPNGTSAQQDITKFVTWNSSNNSIASIDTTGLSTAGSTEGSTFITAALNGVTGNASLTSARVATITLPTAPSLNTGSTQTLAATGILSDIDATSRDISSMVSWVSNNPSVATISPTGVVTGISPGTAGITATFAGITGAPVIGTTTLTVQGPSSITVTPANASAVTGSTVQYSAIGTFADGSSKDMTTMVTWSSSNAAIASISNLPGSRGVATANGTGTATISATLGISGSTSLAVKTLSSLVITPTTPTVGLGGSVQLAAVGTLNDGSTQDLTNSVTWGSSSNSIATVSDTSGSKGLVHAVSFGTATITGTFRGLTGSTMVSVVQTNRALVTDYGISTVSVIDTRNNTVIDSINVGAGPQGIAVHPAINRAYVANSNGSSVSVINTATDTVIATVGVGLGPMGIAINTSAGRVYVANSLSGTVSVINTTDNTVTTPISLGISARPRDIAFNPANSRAYVSNNGNNTVSVINTTNNAVIDTIQVGAGPQELAVDPANNHLYVVNSNGGNISVIDTTTDNIMATVPVGANPQGIAVDSVADRIYVTNQGSNTLSIINAATNTVVSTVNVGSGPQGVTVGNGRLYVANTFGNTVTVLDGSGNLVTTVAVGAGPEQVAILP